LSFLEALRKQWRNRSGQMDMLRLAATHSPIPGSGLLGINVELQTLIDEASLITFLPHHPHARHQ